MTSTPIAIIGYDACLPAGRDREHIDAFLTGERSAVVDVPRDAMLAAGVPELELDRADYVARSARAAWSVDEARHLKGLTELEKRVTDPQHLLFLDCCIGALHDAGINPETARGQDIAVVGGIGMGLYAGDRLASHFTTVLKADTDTLESAAFPEVLIGNTPDHCVGRVSYRLGLTGHSVNVQTACSTAAATVQHAMMLLRSGRVDTALAGAAALYFPNHRGYQWERGGILSPTGQCRAFDRAADGTVGGSGGGVFVLRRLDDAVTDGNTIHGVIEGVYEGNDGGGRVSYAAPAFEGQARVVRGALADADLTPDDISYVEGHGTGTRVGDVLELNVLQEVFSGRSQPPPVGSVKPALGHLDTAAGVASIVNVLLGLRRGWMPSTVNFTQLPEDAQQWTPQPSNQPVQLSPRSDDGVTRVGVSCFGASGTSLHLILSDAHISNGGQATARISTAASATDTGPPSRADSSLQAGRPLARPISYADANEIASTLIRLVRERADVGGMSDEQVLQIGLVDFGVDSVDLIALSKVISARWGVDIDILELLAMSDIREIVDIVRTAATG